MTLYYSNSTKGFYDTDVGYASLPDDIIELTKEQYDMLLHGVNVLHKKIQVIDGAPTLVEPDPVLPTWEIIRSKRDRFLARSDYTQMSDWPGDKSAWATYRQALRDIPQTYVNPEDVIWPSPPEA